MYANFKTGKQQTVLSLFLFEINIGLAIFKDILQGKLIPLIYRAWDMLVDLNLYVQTICSYYEFPRQRKFMRFWINPGG